MSENSPVSLVLEDVYVSFDGFEPPGLSSVFPLSLRARACEWISLIGYNGIGKSSLMCAIAGVVRIRGGSVSLFGQKLSPTSPYDRYEHGVVFVGQDASVPSDLTLGEFATIAIRGRCLPVVSALQNSRPLETFEQLMMRLARSSRIRNDSRLSDLSINDQRLFELCVAVSVNPQVILLDEIGATVESYEQQRVLYQFVQSTARNATVLFSEHNPRIVKEFSHRSVELREDLPPLLREN